MTDRTAESEREPLLSRIDAMYEAKRAMIEAMPAHIKGSPPPHPKEPANMTPIEAVARAIAECHEAMTGQPLIAEIAAEYARAAELAYVPALTANLPDSAVQAGGMGLADYHDADYFDAPAQWNAAARAAITPALSSITENSHEG